MKRDTNLQTLSWEHHEGLVLAFRIEQGLRKKRDPELVRSYVLDTWEKDLVHHFWQEEQMLPEVLNQTPEGRNLLTRLMHDHQQLREMIADMDKKYVNIEAGLENFAKELNAHIRFEERTLFPFVEQRAGKNELEAIGKFLNEQHRSGKKCWEPAFWRQ